MKTFAYIHKGKGYIEATDFELGIGFSLADEATVKVADETGQWGVLRNQPPIRSVTGYEVEILNGLWKVGGSLCKGPDGDPHMIVCWMQKARDKITQRNRQIKDLRNKLVAAKS